MIDNLRFAVGLVNHQQNEQTQELTQNKLGWWQKMHLLTETVLALTGCTGNNTFINTSPKIPENYGDQGRNSIITTRITLTTLQNYLEMQGRKQPMHVLIRAHFISSVNPIKLIL